MSRTATTRVQRNVPFSTAEEVAASLPADAALAISGFGSVGYPKAIPRALVDDDRDLALRIVSGGSVGEVIDSDLMRAGAIARRFPYQAQPAARERVNRREVAFNDRHIWSLGDEVAFGQLFDGGYTAIVEAVAVGDDWYIPSTSIGPTPSFVDGADRLVIELNESQPLSLQHLHDVHQRAPPPHRSPVTLHRAGERIGDSMVRFDPDKLTDVVRTDSRDSPYSFRELTSRERGIGANLVDFLAAEHGRNPLLQDTVHLQFGVGNIGNALMAELDKLEFDDTELVYFGEVIQDGLLEMIEQGVVETASATSLALSSDGQRKLFENMETFAENIVIRPSSVSNNASVINCLGVVGINSAIEVDIYGHANSTHVEGSRLVNGIGGSGDFIRNSHVSILALPSTAKDGAISRVVPMVPHVDHTEHDINVVITEQGVADLRGLSPTERAVSLIDNCAHPGFRDELRGYFEEAKKREGHIPHDLDSAFSMHQS